MTARSHRTTRTAILAGLLAVTALTACTQPPAIDPWREDAIAADAWKTPSVEGIMAANDKPAVRHRDTDPIHAPHVDPGVPHYPLGYEDPFEDKGDGDGRFAWTYADYLHGFYGLGRFILNNIGMPVTAVVTPPWQPTVSDGVTGKDHDATPGESPDPTATRADFHYETIATAEPETP